MPPEIPFFLKFCEHMFVNIVKILPFFLLNFLLSQILKSAIIEMIVCEYPWKLPLLCKLSCIHKVNILQCRLLWTFFLTPQLSRCTVHQCCHWIVHWPSKGCMFNIVLISGLLVSNTPPGYWHDCIIYWDWENPRMVLGSLRLLNPGLETQIGTKSGCFQLGIRMLSMAGVRNRIRNSVMNPHPTRDRLVMCLQSSMTARIECKSKKRENFGFKSLC